MRSLSSLFLACLLLTSLPVAGQGQAGKLEASPGSGTGTSFEAAALNKSIPLANNVTARVSVLKFKVGVDEHESWCYRTSGMNEIKQPEMFMLVLKKSSEQESAFPREPLKLMAHMAKPPVKEPFNQLDFAHFKCFPPLEFAGVMLAPYDGLANIDVSKNSLALIALSEDEFEAAKLAGVTRVKAMLAKQSSYYPCPIWCDRARSSTVSNADLLSMKKDPTITSLPSFGSFASCLLDNGSFSLRLSPEEGKLIAQSLEKYNYMLRISLTFHPRASAFLVWSPPGSKEQHAVGPGAGGLAQVSGEFIALIGGAKRNALTDIDDGFMLELDEQNAKTFADALSKRGEFSLALSSGKAKTFKVDWVQTDYYNPIDQTTLHAPGGWATYGPQGKASDHLPPANKSNEVKTNSVRLLNSDDELSRAMSVETLASYIKTLEEAALKPLKQMRPKKPQQVLIQCELSPGRKPEFKIAVNPSEEGIGPIIKDLYAALNASKAAQCKGKMAFQLLIDVPAAAAK